MRRNWETTWNSVCIDPLFYYCIAHICQLEWVAFCAYTSNCLIFLTMQTLVQPIVNRKCSSIYSVYGY